MDISHKFSSLSFLLFLCCLIPWVSIGDFSSRGEPREALVVQAMVTSGNYILPKSYNDSIPSKPPLFHWLGTLASKMTGGVSEFSVRLPSKIFSLLALIFFVWFLGDKFSRQTVIIFILLLSLSFEWLRASVSARVDMVHASSLSCGLLSGFLALTKGQIRYWTLTAVFLGFSMLAKGPVAIIIPAIILAAWVLLIMDRKLLMSTLVKLACTFAVSTAIGLLWYLAAYLESPEKFLDKVWYENVSRMAGSMHDSPHEHSMLYLIGVFFLGTLPWSPFVIYQFFKDCPKPLGKAKRRLSSRTQFEEFSLLSVAVIFLFYSIPDSKRGVYLLAAYPFLTALCAINLDKIKVFSEKALSKTLAISFCIVILVQLITRFAVSDRASERIVAETLRAKISESSSIYSYGYEFYGASFYLGKTFLRLEDWAVHPDHSFIVYYKSDEKELAARLEAIGLPLENVTEITLGRKKVCIVKV